MNMQSHKKKIVLSGGGSGGHVFPLLEVAKCLMGKEPVELIYYGSGNKIERTQAQINKIAYKKILCGKFRRNVTIGTFLLNFVDFFAFIAGVGQSIFLLIGDRPDVVFSKGGYVSLPVIIASAIVGIPCVVHESDILPGLANRIASRFAKRFCVAWPINAYSTEYRKKAIYCGVPVAGEFFSAEKGNEHILIFGGSQGAQKINDHFFDIASKLLTHHKIVHITGELDYKRAIKYKDSLEGVQYKNYEVIEFSSDMANLIARAKLVISRPGASSIFEIASIGKSAIFIPISPLVTAHQAVNAAYLEKNGYAKVFSQDKKSSVLLKMIQSSLAEKDTSISKLGFPLSGEKISQIILDEIQAIKFKKNVKKVHLIGIGGVSMSAIGKLLTQIKITVSGSDIRLGGHQEENVSIDTDLVAFSSAAGESSKAKPEHIRARQLEIPILRRAQLISEIAGNKSIIAVSGMHGKTTISSLISRMLEKSGYNPSFLIGAQSTPANPTAHIGHGEHFVIEACEYDDSFLDLAPEIALISNIEREHLDYFKGGLTQIKEHFGLFVSRIRPGGALVYCYDSQSVRDVIKDCQGLISSRNISVFSYGTDRECDFYLNKYSVSGGRAKFAIKNKKLGETEFASQITGEHFALNVAGALAVGAYLGLSSSPIASVAQTFQGANRRFNFVGKTNSGALVYDDYGHHPTELMYTLRALSEKFPKEEKTVVFQPHQQSRFNEFYGDFEKVFSDLDEINIILLPVFRVEGRDERASHSSAELVEKLSKTKQAKYFQTYSQASDYLENQLHSGDIVITIGATSVNKVGENLIKNN